MTFVLLLVLISVILVTVALLDHVYNEGNFFFVSEKKELTQALITLCIPVVNILVFIIIIQKHMMEKKGE